MHTQGGDAFETRRLTADRGSARVPLGFDIVQGRLPLAQLRVLSIPRTWHAFTRITVCVGPWGCARLTWRPGRSLWGRTRHAP